MCKRRLDSVVYLQLNYFLSRNKQKQSRRGIFLKELNISGAALLFPYGCLCVCTYVQYI